MDLHYDPENPRRVRDGARPSEIARQRPALVTRAQGRESYSDFDARKTLRGGHFTDEETPMTPEPMKVERFVMDETERCEQMNKDLRRGHTLDVVGDAG